MKGLFSNFGESVVLVIAVVVLAAGAAVAVAIDHRRRGRLWVAAAARWLAVGAAMATIVATALPRSGRLERDGDLVWRIGGAGLGDLAQVARDPNSLAGVELLGNVLLYAAVGFLAVLGWYRSRRFVMPWCLGLSLGVESVQYLFLGRVAATDDVIVNTLGAAIGFGGALALVRLGVVKRSSIVEAAASGLGRAP